MFNHFPYSGKVWFSHKHEDEILIVDVYREVSSSRPRVLDPARFSFSAALGLMWRIASALLVKPTQQHGVTVVGFRLILRNALCLPEI